MWVRAFNVAEATTGEDILGTFDNRRSILHQFPFRAQEGPAGRRACESNASGRVCSRARACACKQTLGSLRALCSSSREKTRVRLTPPSSLSAAEAIPHLGAPGVKGLRSIAIVNAGNGELCAWATCNAHLAKYLDGMCVLRACARPRRLREKRNRAPPHAPFVKLGLIERAKR